MDIILAVELVEYLLSGVVGGVRDDIITPFDCAENIGAFRTVQNCGALDGHDFFVRIGADDQCVNQLGGLPDSVKVPGVAQVIASVHIPTI